MRLNNYLDSSCEQTQETAEPMTEEALQQRVTDLVAANGGEIPSVSKVVYLKCNHGRGYNQYGSGGEGIWVRPIEGDDEEGIGFLANTSLEHGVWGDLVQYSTYNPDCNPVILTVASGDAFADARKRQFDRAEGEQKRLARNRKRRERYAARKAQPPTPLAELG